MTVPIYIEAHEVTEEEHQQFERSKAISEAYERLIEASARSDTDENAFLGENALRVIPTLDPQDQVRVLMALIGVMSVRSGPIRAASIKVLVAATQ